jgi:hypothetical protein
MGRGGGGPATSAFLPPPAATAHPSPAPSVDAPAVIASPIPAPTSPAQFILAAPSAGQSIYLNPNLGFSVVVDLPDSAKGTWVEHGQLPDVGGEVVFVVPVRGFAGGLGDIAVVVGSKQNPAAIRIGVASPVARLWQPSLVALVQAYALLLDGQLGSETPVTLDGERALLLGNPGGAAAVVLAVHNGRVYVISALDGPPSQGWPGTTLAAFVASFRFVDATTSNP